MKRHDTNNKENECRTTAKKRRFSAVEKILLAIGIAAILLSAVLFLWEPVSDLLRKNETNTMLQKIKAGESTMVVSRDALAVNGEGYEVLVRPEESYADPTDRVPAPTVAPLPEDVVLTVLGTIAMEKIDLNLPLFDGAGIVPLRYGAGVLEGTAKPGEEGNCVILGHRMKAFGSIFNRLDEMAVGDGIVITATDGKEYTYIVDQVIPKLSPDDLGSYIKADAGKGKQLTLVTCTPTGIGSHRLLVIAHLQE